MEWMGMSTRRSRREEEKQKFVSEKAESMNLLDKYIEDARIQGDEMLAQQLAEKKLSLDSAKSLKDIDKTLLHEARMADRQRKIEKYIADSLEGINAEKIYGKESVAYKNLKKQLRLKPSNYIQRQLMTPL